MPQLLLIGNGSFCLLLFLNRLFLILIVVWPFSYLLSGKYFLLRMKNIFDIWYSHRYTMLCIPMEIRLFVIKAVASWWYKIWTVQICMSIFERHYRKTIIISQKFWKLFELLNDATRRLVGTKILWFKFNFFVVA